MHSLRSLCSSLGADTARILMPQASLAMCSVAVAIAVSVTPGITVRWWIACVVAVALRLSAGIAAVASGIAVRRWIARVVAVAPGVAVRWLLILGRRCSRTIITAIGDADTLAIATVACEYIITVAGCVTQPPIVVRLHIGARC